MLPSEVVKAVGGGWCWAQSVELREKFNKMETWKNGKTSISCFCFFFFLNTCFGNNFHILKDLG